MKKSFIKITMIFLVSAFCCGCSSVNYQEDDDDLCTIPTTNNPLLIPGTGGSGIPGMPSQMPQ